MPRTSTVHYIAPSAISIVPNANGSANDIAVQIANGAKIKVYSKGITELKTNPSTNTYCEWQLSGKNRRLADSSKPYTIYARLEKFDYRKGYLVFAPKNQNGAGWVDKYYYVTPDGLSNHGGGTSSSGYWYVRLGEVSLPENGQRTVTLDTGILGTDQYNEEWNYEPDDMPLRVEVGCTINDEDAGPTPYVAWNQEVVLTANLVRGWSTDANSRVHHWGITRNTGNADADAAWNNEASHRTIDIDNVANDFADCGQIVLSHVLGDGDDFAESAAVAFTLTAYGEVGDASDSSSSSSDSSDTTPIAPLASYTITILAEEVEIYELVLYDRNDIAIGNSLLVARGSVDEVIKATLHKGGRDVSDEVLAWSWDMIGGDGTEYLGFATTRQITLTDADLPASWSTSGNVSFRCHATVGDDTITTTLKMANFDVSNYDIDFSGYVDVITVDDVGNCIGGLWTTSGDNNEHRSYRIHSAISVRKNGTPLLYTAPTGTAIEGDEEAATSGHYKIYGEGHGCSFVIEDSTLYITGIDNIKDGVAGSQDDQNFDYDAMRLMESCSVDIVIDCEGVGSIQKSFPVTIKHDSQPFVGSDLDNPMSSISWNTRTQSFIGLPIVIDMKLWHNNEYLSVENTSNISLATTTAGVTLVDCNGVAPSPIAANSIYYGKSLVTMTANAGTDNAYTYKVARITIVAAGPAIPLVNTLDITCTATYSGIEYERTLRHTLNKGTDVNVYSLLTTPSDVAVTDGVLSANSIGCTVFCDSTDNKHYIVSLDANGKNTTHKLMLCWQRDTDDSESPYTGAVSIDSTVKNVTFRLYGLDNQDHKDATTIHDTEDVPILTAGKDGISVESYLAVQEAWGNSTTTPPSTGWSDSTPAKDGKYLWRRTRKMVLNAAGTAYEPYGDGSWSYQLLSGIDGTSIATKGTVVCVKASSDAWPSTGLHDGDLGIIITSDSVYEYESLGSHWLGTITASDGDAYVNDADRHLWMWSSEASRWLDLGQFKGENGTTYFTHVAWADSATGTFSGTIPAGQISTPNKGSVGNFSVAPVDGYGWMGILINTTDTDPTSESATYYTWQNVKGEKGDASVRYWLRPSTTLVRVDDDGTTPATMTVDLMRTEGNVTRALTSIPSGLAEGMSIELYLDGTSSMAFSDINNPTGFYDSWGQGMLTSAFSQLSHVELRLRARTTLTVYDSVMILVVRSATTWRFDVDVDHFRFSRDYAGVLTASPSSTNIRVIKSCGERQTVYDGTNALPNNIHLGWISPNKTWATAPTLGVNSASTLMTGTGNQLYPSTSIGLYEGGTVQSNYTVNNGTLLAMLTFTAEVVTQRMLVPAGEWNPSTTYNLTDRTCPLVLYHDHYYYLIADTSTNNHPNENNNENDEFWKLAEDYEVILTKMLFAQFANVGGFVYCEYWFISQFGTLISNSGKTLVITDLNNTTSYGADNNGNIVTAGAAGNLSAAYGWFDYDDPIASGYSSMANGNLLFVPTLAMHALTGDVYFAGGKVHFDHLGNVSVEGTIKATNLFRNVCLFRQDAFYSNDCYYCSVAPSADFSAGRYYTEQEIYDLDGNPADTYEDPEVVDIYKPYFIPTTYDADVVVMVPNTSQNSNGGWHSARYEENVLAPIWPMLPNPSDFLGKLVEVSGWSRDSEEQTVAVGCVVYNAMSNGINVDGQGRFVFAVPTSDEIAIRTGETYKFLSMKIGNDTRWVLLGK